MEERTKRRTCTYYVWRGVFFISMLYLAISGVRILGMDRFVVRGESMEPTLLKGRHIWVDKTLMGPRIYTDLNFADGDLHCIRLSGKRQLRRGDIAVFNFPYGRGGDLISFKINDVYCKRCWGVPGDTIRIEDGCLCAHDNRITVSWARLKAMPDSLLLAQNVLKAGQFAGEDWTIKNFGPILVPKRGMTVVLDSVTIKHYSRAIAWERRHQISARDKEKATYTFQHDWYFFVGDNISNSYDSRYFGFVPDDFIIGIIFGSNNSNHEII